MKQNYIAMSLSLLIFIFATGISFPAPAQDQTSINAKLELREFRVNDYTFQDTNLKDTIYKLADAEGLNVIFHISSVGIVNNKKVNLKLEKVSAPYALEVLFKDNDLCYTQVDRRTIMIASAINCSGVSIALEDIIINAGQEEIKEAKEAKEGIKPAGRFRLKDLRFTPGSPIKFIINAVAGNENLNVEYDNDVLEEVLKIKTDLKLCSISVPSALRCILRANDLDYEHTGFRTIKIVHKNQSSNPPSLEEILTMAE